MGVFLKNGESKLVGTVNEPTTMDVGEAKAIAEVCRLKNKKHWLVSFISCLLWLVNLLKLVGWPVSIRLALVV